MDVGTGLRSDTMSVNSYAPGFHQPSSTIDPVHDPKVNSSNHDTSLQDSRRMEYS